MHRSLRGLAALALLIAFALPAAALSIGEAAPDFTLSDLDGKEHQLAVYLKAGKTVVLEWFNPQCPFIVKHHQTLKTMNETATAAAKDGVVWLAINSGAPGKQGHGLELNQKAAKEFALAFPLLIDEAGAVGKAYGAKTTPHLYVISPDGKLRYQGAIDDAPNPGGPAGETNYVADALAALAAGKPVAMAETRPYGCGVKYGE
jgi:peroxiredoxin